LTLSRERFISSRIVHFAKEQVIWDCQENVACEQNPEEVRYWKDGAAFNIFTTPKASLRLLSSTESVSKAQGKWASIVMAYSRSQLSFLKDKVIAVSGLAKLGAELWNDEYCAGLWRKSIELQLCWWCDSVQPPPNKDTPLRSPSWSWLSLDGPVGCTQTQEYDGDAYDQVLHATVTDVSLKHTMSKSAGEIISGYLYLRGFLNPVTFDKKEEIFLLGAGTTTPLILLRVDIDQSEPFGELFFIPIYDILAQGSLDSSIKDIAERRGILVELVDRASGRYRRRGHVFHGSRASSNGAFPIEFSSMVTADGKQHISSIELDPILGHLIELV
jgi:hypothetical protein